MLQLERIEAGYGSVQILNGVTLAVERGRIVALLGGNGTGKSTLLKTISGLLKPWQGAVTFDGGRIDGLRPDRIVRRGLVQVTQGKEAYPAMTVEENLRLGAFLVGDRGRIRRSFERVYTYFPRLAERRRQLSATLSGGELQMLCIGRGLMSEPKMMLLDEPSAALAPQVVLDIFRTIGRICREGMTLLLVEQNVRMALLLAEYAYVLRDGAVHLEGPADALIDDDNVRLSYLGGAGTLAPTGGD
ncbi:MAG: ABC transporter ATP-binding protein [Xanthobacteraceae bacterium]|nr:ABC transporter ATP-binding protein [Xanthobacteraceae bacterium]